MWAELGNQLRGSGTGKGLGKGPKRSKQAFGTGEGGRMTDQQELCSQCGRLAFFMKLCLTHYREWRQQKRGRDDRPAIRMEL